MVKRIIRAGLGVIFLLTFLTFLLTGAIRFRALSPSFWKTALNKGAVYQLLEDKVTEAKKKMTEDITKLAGGQALPPQITGLFSAADELTEARFRELIETNIDRASTYLNGQSQNLVLYLPVKEWNLPVEFFGQPALSQLNSQTPIEEAMAVMGYKGETAKPALDTVKQMKGVTGQLTIIWIVLLVTAVGILAGHFFLGAGLVDRISGTAWLAMISGFLASFVSVGVNGLVEFIISNSKRPLDPWIVQLLKSLVGQFFNWGATVGLVAGLSGLAGIVITVYLVKTGKLKKEKEQIGLIKKILAFILGVILSLAVLLGILMAIGGKVNFKTGTGANIGSPGQMTLTETPYESKNGWSIRYPAGWEVAANEQSEGFLKKPSGVATNWATMEIKKVNRPRSVDEGGYVAAVKQELLSGKSGLKNLELAEEPSDKPSEQFKMFTFMFDFDTAINGTETRIRTYVAEFHPTTGDSYSVVSRTPVVSWDIYKSIIMQATETFKLGK